MSAIDCFKHELIGFVRCPMRHSHLRDDRVFDRLPVYRLLENISDESSISGRAGDVLIGGGSGEANALSFSIPEIFIHFTQMPDVPGKLRTPAVVSHWSVDDAFIFGVGFECLGWSPERQPLQIWLTEHLMAYLVRIFPDQYGSLVGEFPPQQDGSIFIVGEAGQSVAHG